MAQQPSINMTSKGAISCSQMLMDSRNGVWFLMGAAAPTNGTSGTGATFANVGSVYIDISAGVGKMFINTNTQASPTWTAVGAQTA